MNSIFSKTYSYRQRENKNNRENFLTEIFAFCLQKDKLFLKSFLDALDLQSKSGRGKAQTFI